MAKLQCIRQQARTLHIILADRKAGLLADLQKASTETQGILGSWTKQISDDVERLRGVTDILGADTATRLVAQTEWMGPSRARLAAKTSTGGLWLSTRVGG